MPTDPVCGHAVSPKQSDWLVTYRGRAYHFCGSGCAADFRADPGSYAPDSAAPEPRAMVVTVIDVASPTPALVEHQRAIAA